MGKKIVDEDMNLNIIINGDKGKKTLYELEERVRDLNSENEKLERNLQKYDKEITKNENTIAKYSRTLEKEVENQSKLEKSFLQARKKVAELHETYKQLDATGKKSSFGQKIYNEMIKAEHAANKSANAGLEAIEAQKNLRAGIEKLSKATATLKQKRDADTNSLNTNKAAVSDAGTKISALRKNLDVTTLSLDELNREIAITNAKFRQTDPNDPKWKEYQATLVKLRTRQQELSSQAQQTKGVLCRMADGINKYWSFILAGFYSVKKVFDVIEGAVSKFVEFEDILSDTQKTTGLTKQEVQELNETLKQIDTRTAQEELQGLARIGGKLGIEGKENLEGFVRAADQINVALKEDLGGDTEEAIRQVGKLVDIFKVKDDFGIEQGLLKVGSVINELGAASTANEGFIVEFSKRVAGVAPSAGISVDAVMGLAATLDQFGQQAEASSTVYSQMMAKMFKNTAAYANIAGMSLTEFSDLMNRDANEAFIRVLEGLKGNNEGMEALVKNLGDMQLNGVRSTTILGTLADNTATLREQQKLANEAFREGTSLTNEFNIKNNNAAALAEKQKKVRNDLIRDLGQKLQPIMVAHNDVLNKGLQILNTLVGFVVKHGATLAVTTAAIAAYTAGVKLSTIANKSHLTSIGGVIANLKKLFTTLSLNPWGMAITAVTGLAMAIYKVATYSTDAEKAQKRLQDSLKESEGAALSEQRELAKLKGELDAATKGTAEYDKIKNKIIEKYGKYDANLKDEMEKVGLLDETYQKLTESIRKSFGARQYEKFRQDESDNLDQVLSENLGKIQDRLLKEKGDELGTKYYSIIRDALLKGEDLSKEITAVLDEVQDKGTIMADGRLDSYVRNIQKAQKLFEETDKKAKVKFGIEIPRQNIKSLEELNIELSVAEKRLEDLERVRPDIFSEDEIARQKEYIAGLKDSIKVLNNQGKTTSKVNNKPDAPAVSTAPDYDARIIALKQSYAQQKITKEKYEKQLDQLELSSLQNRLKNFEGTEEKRIELQQKIADKQVAIREKQDKEEKTQALEILEKQHQDNLQKIEEDAQKKAMEAQKKEKERQKKESDDYMKGITDRIRQMETAHKMEIGQKKSEYYDNLDKADSPGQRNRLTKDFRKDMAGLTEKQAGEMAGLLNDLVVEMDVDSDADLGSVILSPEQKEQVLERLNQVRENVQALKELSDYATAENYGVDILGMDAGQWEVFFEHIEDGKLGIEDMQVAIQGVSAAWSAYDKLRSAQENKQLKEYEKATKKKKAALDKQLEHGQISQEQYNAKTSKLDADLDAKKEAIEKKQAERSKRMAMFQTIMNLAAAMVQLWVKPGFPVAIPMAIVLGALGAVQLATIAAAQYAQGKYPVIGEDDGRTYQADYAGDNLRTGVYQKPTLGLFSEKEPEMVVDGATTRKLIFNYPQIYQSIMDVSHGRTPQFAEGRYPVTPADVSATDTTIPVGDPEIKQLLKANLAMMEVLKNKNLEIAWYGRGGIDEKMKRAQKYENNIKIKS